MTSEITKRKTEMNEDQEAKNIAYEACTERQPMPSRDIRPAIIAGKCEEIGERYIKEKRWVDAAYAFRVACYYWQTNESGH